MKSIQLFKDRSKDGKAKSDERGDLDNKLFFRWFLDMWELSTFLVQDERFPEGMAYAKRWKMKK
jgi:hypothetical protein